MTSSLKLDIRVARDAGGTHLVRSVDEMDLPWLLDLISELQIERAAVVILTDAVRGDELVIRIEQDRYHVERSIAGARSWLASDRMFESPDGSDRAEAADRSDAVDCRGGSGPAEAADRSDPVGARADAAAALVDLEAARGALRSVVAGQPLEAGVRWVRPGG